MTENGGSIGGTALRPCMDSREWGMCYGMGNVVNKLLAELPDADKAFLRKEYNGRSGQHGLS